MTPTPQELGTARQTTDTVPPASGVGVIISGMAGLYPQAQHVKDLEKILYDKVNPVSADFKRWKYNHPEAVQCTGNVPDLDRFDAQFFKVAYRQGHAMDPLGRKLLEQAYEAIYDAGINPDQLNGKKVGVFIGTSLSESEKSAFYEFDGKSGLGLPGCSRTMFANRISYWLNAKGPSMNIDEACCSSTAALEQAYQAIARGECESAIVGGAHLCLHPHSAVHFGRVLALDADGKTKSFDQNAAGTALSEAVNVLFLQKSKDALRIYANVLHVKCGFNRKANISNDAHISGFCRNPNDNANFLRDFYVKAGVSPNLVEYVEALGAADSEVDKAELEAFDRIFCKDRKEPLIVGSVMSNIGYCGAATGISAITKVLIGYNKGELAGNLHCDVPRSDVAGLRAGRIRIMNDHQRFRRTYAAVNTMSVTGANGHVLLHGHSKLKDINRYETKIPRLVNVSGRQESAVTKVFEELKCHPIDPEQLALLHNIHESRITGHLGRGFIILDNDKEQKSISLSEKVDYFDDSQRPLWFVYSGMGSQWPGMGVQLMRIPIFAAAIERCRRALEPKGIDIVQIITSPDKSIFDNILHSFVGIAAVQIGLTDVLSELGLVPDKIIGHSVGELGCAYADGCLTAEEMILSAYSRGLVSLETPFIQGAMAAVGTGFNQISEMCPPDIQVACHNGPDSCTISGPVKAIREFIVNLKDKGIFTKEVPCSNIAFHSRYIEEAGPGLNKYLKEIIKTPVLRSERWVSTSVPQDKWKEPMAKYSSAEYHTNNLLSPVLFEETSRLIPHNAVLVELAPHGLLQAILKRSLPQSCTNIPLTRRGHPDNVLMVLEAIGRLYIEGYNPKIRVLYPKVDFPVSAGTPFLSHFVEWIHTEKWYLMKHFSAVRKVAAACEFLISVYDDEYNYLKGHVIRKNILLPFSFALVAAWDTLSMSMNIPKKTLNVEFRDVQFYVQPILYYHHTSRLTVSLLRGSGWFEIMNGNSRVASGYIINTLELKNTRGLSTLFKASEEIFELSSDEIYQLLSERDYSYDGEFRSIFCVDTTLTKANLVWNQNWVTLIDGIIQLNTVKHYHNSVTQPDQIARFTINVEEHHKSLIEVQNGTVVINACVSDLRNLTRCGGIVMENLKFNVLPPAINGHVSLKSLKYVPRFHSDFDVLSSLQVMMQIVAENIHKNIINVIGITGQNTETGIFKDIKVMMEENIIPGITIQYQLMHTYDIEKLNTADLVVVQNLSNDNETYQILCCNLPIDAFMINEESLDNTSCARPTSHYDVVSLLKNKVRNTRLELARWRPTPTFADKSSTRIIIRSETDLPLLTTARNKLAPEDSLVIIASYPPVDGLKDMVKQWRTDTTCNRICLILATEVEILEELPNVNLTYNISNEGEWGGEYYLPMTEKPSEKEKITLRCEQVGNLNSLQWVYAPEPMKNGNLVEVHFAGINVNDMKKAAGLVPFENLERHSGTEFGMEFSGLTESGERVMGLVQQGAVSSHVMAEPQLLWPVPPHWTLEDAATVPFAYVYAYYCLKIKGAIRVVENNITKFSVLVHGGAGTMGQAMISIALAMGFKVFATVSDLKKKRFLLRLFPELYEDDIGSSRDTSFGDMILNATNGKGCDIVLCCVKGELKNTSLKCCGSSGTTFDTVLIKDKENYPFGMSYLTCSRTYMPVDFSSVFSLKSEDLKLIQSMISDGIAVGEVRPLSRVSFAAQDAPHAFNLLAASRHRGRVLLKLDDLHLVAQPRLSCDRDRCHMILCDKQTLGLQLADTLISHGANRIHIHIESPSSHLHIRLNWWAKLNVQVSVSSESLKSENDFINLLHEASNSSPLDGVYVIADNFLSSSVISGLDWVTRKFYRSLKNFVVLSENGNSGQNICIARANDGLPATVVDLCMLKTFYNNDSSWHQQAIEATVLALHSRDTVLFAQPQLSPQFSLLEQISALGDIQISDETSTITTLAGLGMVMEKSHLVSALLRNIYHISLNEENIPSLTIQEIKQMEERIQEPVLKEINGLHKFFSYVDPDELLATTEMILMPTLTNKSSMKEDEFEVNEMFLCIVPGLEGHHARFRTLCERLKLPAIVLQPGLDRPDESLQELAARFAEILEKNMGSKKNFNLLGYETGVIVALELAAVLEEHGKTGTVYCLGDGPEEMQALLEMEALAFGSEMALQESVARHMFALMARSTSGAPAESALSGSSSWRARVDASVRTLLGRVSHSAQYARALVESAYARISTARRYNAEPRTLRSRLVLLRARRTANSEEECSLQRYTKCALIVTDLATPMPHITADLRVPAIINRYLDDEILQAFEKRNLCESYLLNSETFSVPQ